MENWLMVCDCCGRKKRLFESFAKITIKDCIINLCVECNDLMYKIRDANNEGNDNDFNKYKEMIEKHSNKSTPQFIKWKEKFIEDMGNKKDNVNDDDNKTK